jgi:hypothetical protein
MLLIASVVQPDEHEPVRAVLAAGADRPNVDRPRFVPECEWACPPALLASTQTKRDLSRASASAGMGGPVGGRRARDRALDWRGRERRWAWHMQAKEEALYEQEARMGSSWAGREKMMVVEC